MSDTAAAVRQELIPSTEMILEHSGGIDLPTWIAMGDHIVHGMFVGVAKMGPDAQVLDVGCGCAKVARPLVDYLSAAGGYHGIDVGAECIDWCRQAYSAYPNFHFHHADLFTARYNPQGKELAESYRFPVESGTVDMVFLGSVFTHLVPASTENYLREIARVLKPGGTVIATYFVLEDASRENVIKGLALPRFDFELPGGSGCRVGDPEVPEAAIAYEEAYLRQAYKNAGLDLFHISLGKWGRGDIVPHWQDEVWARKPK
ncbi:MAG TPA: class I SAM-dependent methyltransferase [Phenylobacterium sp.]